MTVLSIAATAVVIVTIGVELAGRLSRKTASGILALAFTAGSIAASTQRTYVVAYLHAALAA